MNTEVIIKNGSTSIVTVDKNKKRIKLNTANTYLANNLEIELTNIEGTATANDVMPGKTAYVDGTQITGTATSDATATSSDILTNKTAYVNGVKLTGNMVNYSKRWHIPHLCFTAITAGSTIELTKVGSPSISNTAYKLNNGEWTAFTPSTTAGTNTITLENIGDKVYFKNDIIADFSSANYLLFVMTGSISASGNCNSMYSSTNFGNLTILVYKYCYCSLFKNCTSLVSMPDLPATTLSNGCYNSMFSGCTNLVTIISKLPATAIVFDAYHSMFYGCTSLATAPEIMLLGSLMNSSAVSMFKNCSNLNSILVHFIDWDSAYSTYDWVEGVASSGTFICPTTLEEKRGIAFIPENWTLIRQD